ncbi:hypothetical protein D9615_007136 [Tricholomella constricta]|uniref:P-loop containing nucleoside triphosphate hydrolase protein n=1 Tax=Tricholomella constricta TaxID=117010 RepID=A0A8H5M250_9AGAR|nr:hypothetical protein D9615_007136 [Tricholomella constricta]
MPRIASPILAYITLWRAPEYCVTAQFTEGDPSYEWVVLFLTEENVWRQSRDFRVNEKNSQRKWGLKLAPEVDGNADYVPTYKMPQIFRWKGYWIEIKRNETGRRLSDQGGFSPSTMYISIYTLDMKVLYSFVEETRKRYKEVSRPHVTVYMADMARSVPLTHTYACRISYWGPQPTYGPGFVWSNVKHKARRPLSSIILNEGVVESLVKDAQEFIDTEDWYVDAGIPHRRGYLLYGPPGTGKKSKSKLLANIFFSHSSISNKAGELGLEIFTLSLSSGFVDDSFLQKAASSIPKNSILLIEDIDCAFPSREDFDNDDDNYERPNNNSNNALFGFVSPGYVPNTGRKSSSVTLSGLLNVIDGVGSEEGKLFFATTNYINRLDPALLRPGRIDVKLQYKLATKDQATALFLRFFARPGSASSPTSTSASASASLETEEKDPASPSASASTTTPTAHLITALATQFAAHIPENEFSTAELQGFLLSCKKDPLRAVSGAQEWVAREMGERVEKEVREEARRAGARRGRGRGREGAVGGVGEGAGAGGGGGGMVTGGMVVPMDAFRTPSTPSPAPAYEEGAELEPSISPLAMPAGDFGSEGEGGSEPQTAVRVA